MNLFMRVRATTVVAGITIASATTHAAVKGYCRFPTISHDRVVFTCEGDLWRVAVEGGQATRLTTADGEEAFARCSPDGQWIAFSGHYDGNRDVFVMPIEGGAPKRLTFHPGSDQVVAWNSDGSAVVFRSYRHTPLREEFLYEIPIDGGQPRKIDVGIAANACFSPDGRSIAFNRWAYEYVNWKRYKGGTAQDIWLGDLRNGEFRQLTTWEGTDRFPMWRDGRVYFVSDRDDRLNIYSVSAARGEADLRQHTHHDVFDVRWPDLREDRIVYMHGGDLWLLDLETGTTGPVDIELPTDRVRRRPRPAWPSHTLDHFSLDHDGERVLVSARGEMWSAPAKKGGRIIEVTGSSSGTRERLGAMSPDGNTVACISDVTGEQEIVLYDAAGANPPRVLTDRGKGWLFGPVWSPDGAMIAFADMTQSLFVVDVETGVISEAAKSRRAEILEYAFSPDSRWLAYVDREYGWADSGDIYLYNIAENSQHKVTTPFSADRSPAWDPQGRYLFFASSRRFNPMHGDRDYEHIAQKTEVLCALLLREDTPSPFLPDEVIDSMTGETAGDEVLEADTESDDQEEEVAVGEADDEIVVEIDFEGLVQRIVEVPIAAGTFSQLYALNDKLLYMSRDPAGRAKGPDRKPQLRAFDLKEKRDELFIDSIDTYTVSGDGKRLAFRWGIEIYVASVDSPPNLSEVKDRVNVDEFRLTVDPSAEWRQIYDEAWRLQRDFYWDENMAGVDWEKEHQRYLPLVERAGTRTELNDVVGQLLGELGTSHENVHGGDIEGARGINVALLGADLEPDAQADAHRFVRVLRPESWETDVEAPLTMTHARVGEGDFLFAINGREVAASDNIYERLVGLSGKQVQLTVGTTPDRGDARKIQIEALASDKQLRYYDWCRRNREYVEQKTNGQIGYLHLPDMSGRGLVAFIKGFYPQLGKDALVIDIRYNGGGNVSQLVIRRLDREVWAFKKPRRGDMETYPFRAFVGHTALIINHWAGSDGDIFPESYRIKELGPIIGTRTWGGVIGIRSDKPFVDGGMSTQPEYAWWEAKRGWDLENSGVAPDIEVEILPDDYRAGRDPQLDRAVLELRRLLQAQPIERPTPPPAPDKRSRHERQ